MKTDFQIGDVVVVCGETFEAPILTQGKVGVVRRITSRGVIGVVFNENVGGSELGGLCQAGRGLDFPYNYLKKMEPIADVVRRIK